MSSNVIVRTSSTLNLKEFLEENDFFVEQVSDTVLKVNRSGELDVFLNVSEKAIYFEMELGNISAFANEEVYFRLLDLNTEILPVSVGIDTTEKGNPALVLVESREIENLDSNELLAVFDALEIAQDKVETLLAEYLK
jgi:hypothetical protein